MISCQKDHVSNDYKKPHSYLSLAISLRQTILKHVLHRHHWFYAIHYLTCSIVYQRLIDNSNYLNSQNHMILMEFKKL